MNEYHQKELENLMGIEGPKHKTIENILFIYFFLLAVPAAYANSQTRDRT